MTQRYDTPRLLGQPSNADSYHTKECRTVRQSKNEPKEATPSLIEWHELQECAFCSGAYTPAGKVGVVAND